MAELLKGDLRWTVGQPVLRDVRCDGETWISVKDPSIVRFGDCWHLFCTVRGTRRTHAVIHGSFADWKDAQAAEYRVLPCHPGYFCAPQVFSFTPQKKWYLICQASDEGWSPKYQAAYSTTTDIADWRSWSPLKPLGARQADGKTGLDFWVICDEARAHLFFTTLDGRLWREETRPADFPGGWSEASLAIQGDVFEASHTYLLRGSGTFLTLIEAQGGHGWRYFKAYLADRLGGAWRPLAADREKAFASMKNVKQTAARWTDCVSHGELLRSGYDERLEVDPASLRFLFQGVLDADRAGKPYGRIPWRLGILEPAP